MKIQKIISFLIVFILIFIFINLTVYSMTLKQKLTECQKELTNVTNTYIETNTIYHNYDYTFTATYRIVNMLDDYITKVPEYSYIIVDKFQTHKAISHYIPSDLTNILKTNHNYKFTYHIKGNGTINNIYNVINSISSNHSNNDILSTTSTTKETAKTGLEQIQESICNFIS